MTFSDRELQRRIDHNERMLAKVKPDSWTAELLRATLDGLRSQLAKPRDQRMQWEHGSL